MRAAVAAAAREAEPPEGPRSRRRGPGAAGRAALLQIGPKHAPQNLIAD